MREILVARIEKGDASGDTELMLYRQIWSAYKAQRGSFRQYFGFRALQSIEVRGFRKIYQVSQGHDVFVHLSRDSPVPGYEDMYPFLTYQFVNGCSDGTQDLWTGLVQSLAARPNQVLYLQDGFSKRQVVVLMAVWLVVCFVVLGAWWTVSRDLQTALSVSSSLAGYGSVVLGILGYVEYWTA